MLVQRRRQAVTAKRFGHLKCAGRVHIRRDDGDRVVFFARMQEFEFARNVDLTAARERGAFRTDEHVLEVETNGVLNMHA